MIELGGDGHGDHMASCFVGFFHVNVLLGMELKSNLKMKLKLI